MTPVRTFDDSAGLAGVADIKQASFGRNIGVTRARLVPALAVVDTFRSERSEVTQSLFQRLG